MATFGVEDLIYPYHGNDTPPNYTIPHFSQNKIITNNRSNINAEYYKQCQKFKQFV